MYICVCNEISETDLKEKPELVKKLGSQCGICLSYYNCDAHIDTQLLIEISKLKTEGLW